MIKASYHTHTPHCGHALGNSTAEYADAAYAIGMDILGFSDHCPFRDRDLGARMSYETLPIYISEVEELKEKYKGRMEILKGVEIEYFRDCAETGANYYEYLLKELKLDYLLLGQHFFTLKDKSVYNLYDIPDSGLIVDYARDCAEAMSTGYFKMIAHPDLFGVNDFAWDINMDRATEIIIEAALKYDVIIEYNANGFRRGIRDFETGERYMYPLDNFWKEVAKTNAQVIIGSDSHNPNEIWDYVIPRARDELTKLGISFIETI